MIQYFEMKYCLSGTLFKTYLEGFNSDLYSNLGLLALYLALVVVKTAGHQPDDNVTSIFLKTAIKSLILSSPGCCEDCVSTMTRAP